MEEIISRIIDKNISIFENINNLEKINVGFTNTIYSVNDKFIIKICSNYDNEVEFKKEIDFYNSNKDNNLIPKLYYFDISKNDVPYFYEIIEKISGVSLYNVWHTFSEEKREDIIRQVCDAMKSMHQNKGERYNWGLKFKDEFTTLVNKGEELGLFTLDELSDLRRCLNSFEEYLESKEFVLIHNDLHFDNIFIDDDKIKIIDFERSMYAPRDFELDILYRMIRMPWKFASEETEEYTKLSDYENIMFYIEKYYPELINIDNLYKRLAIYDMVYFLNQYLKYPKYIDLKESVFAALDVLM